MNKHVGGKLSLQTVSVMPSHFSYRLKKTQAPSKKIRGTGDLKHCCYSNPPLYTSLAPAQGHLQGPLHDQPSLWLPLALHLLPNQGPGLCSEVTAHWGLGFKNGRQNRQTQKSPMMNSPIELSQKSAPTQKCPSSPPTPTHNLSSWKSPVISRKAWASLQSLPRSGLFPDMFSHPEVRVRWQFLILSEVAPHESMVF